MTRDEVFQYLSLAQKNKSSQSLFIMEQLLLELGSPEQKAPAVHLAGTNGKGSTARLLESCLREAGYKTGLCTSPHVLCFSERIRVNGENISEQELCSLTQKVQSAEAKLGLRLNYFQIVTALAFLHFAKSNCDIAVLETGLGGRLDPTNVLKAPLVSIITAIGLDHIELLGSSIGLIAREKAGIIKPCSDTVLLKQNAQVEAVIRDVCAKQNSRLFIAEKPKAEIKGFGLKLCTGLGSFELGLNGSYQAENAALALCAISRLNEKGFCIPKEAIKEGLKNAAWAGRFERVCLNPLMLIDGAHNPQAALALKESLSAYFPDKRAVFLMAAMQDKDYIGCIKAVAPLAKAMVAVGLNYSRAVCADTLRAAMAQICKNSYAASGVKEALLLAKGLNAELIVGFGSLYLAAPFREEAKALCEQSIKEEGACI